MAGYSSSNAACVKGGKPERDGLEVWPESHWPSFALPQADVFQYYAAWECM